LRKKPQAFRLTHAKEHQTSGFWSSYHQPGSNHLIDTRDEVLSKLKLPGWPPHTRNRRCFFRGLGARRPRSYQQRLALSPHNLRSPGNSGRRYSTSLKTDLPVRRLFAVVSQYRCASDVSVDAGNGA
jgi:hypothetical protein